MVLFVCQLHPDVQEQIKTKVKDSLFKQGITDKDEINQIVNNVLESKILDLGNMDLYTTEEIMKLRNFGTI